MNEIINQQGPPLTGGQKKLIADHERKVAVEVEEGGQNEEVSAKEFKNEGSGNKSEEYLCEGKKEKGVKTAHGQAVDDENKKKVAVQQEDIHAKREDIQGGAGEKGNIGAEKEKQTCTIAPANAITAEEEKDKVATEANLVVTTEEQIQPAAGANLSTAVEEAKEMDDRGNIGREDDNKAHAAMASGDIDGEEFAPGTVGKHLPVEEEGEASVKANVGAEEDEPGCPEPSCGIVVTTDGSGEKKKVKIEFVAPHLTDNKVSVDACSENIKDHQPESL